MHFIVGFGIMLNNQFCAKKKASGLYFYKGHDKVKEGQPNYVRTYVFHMLGTYAAILCN